MVVLKVVRAFDARPGGEVEAKGRLAQHTVLAEHLDGFGFTGTMDANLAVRDDAKPVLEADHGAVIQAEKIAREVAKVAIAERADEAVRHAKRALEQRQTKRSR